MRLFRRRHPKRANVWTATSLATTRLLLVPLSQHTSLRRSGDRAYYQVREFDAEHVIGLVTLHYENFHARNSAVIIDWTLDYDYYNRGYSTEILNVLVEECFVSLGTDMVLVDAYEGTGNPAKANVAIMAGFEQISSVASEVYRKRRE